MFRLGRRLTSRSFNLNSIKSAFWPPSGHFLKILISAINSISGIIVERISDFQNPTELYLQILYTDKFDTDYIFYGIFCFFIWPSLKSIERLYSDGTKLFEPFKYHWTVSGTIQISLNDFREPFPLKRANANLSNYKCGQI